MHAPLSTDRQKYFQLMALVCEDLPTTAIDTLACSGYEATSAQLTAIRQYRKIHLPWLIDLVRAGLPGYVIPLDVLPAQVLPPPLFLPVHHYPTSHAPQHRPRCAGGLRQKAVLARPARTHNHTSQPSPCDTGDAPGTGAPPEQNRSRVPASGGGNAHCVAA